MSIGYVVSLILGVPVDTKMLPFSRIISGPIDADKCDYLARDSSKTGVPVAVDLYRVIQKLKIIKVPPQDLDFGLVWDELQHVAGVDLYSLGVSYSAAKAVEELMLSRSLMHEKIYYHHKIHTAEEMLRQALRLLDEAGFKNLADFQYALRLTDHDIISYHPEHFLKIISNNAICSDDNDCELFKRACQIIKRIINRRLLKRACAFSTNLMGSSAIVKEQPKNIIMDCFAAVEKNKQQELVDLISSETEEVLKNLGRNEINNDCIDYLILPVHIPQALNTGFNMPVECGGKYKKLHELFQAESWDDSRKLAQNLNYIVGD
jgi:HD superfamily phosphohydrolase